MYDVSVGGAAGLSWQGDHPTFSITNSIQYDAGLPRPPFSTVDVEFFWDRGEELKAGDLQGLNGHHVTQLNNEPAREGDREGDNGGGDGYNLTLF